MINLQIQIVYYNLVKTIMDITSLAKILINVIKIHYNLSNSIINNKNALFTSK